MTDGFFEVLDTVADEAVAKTERSKITLSAAQSYIDFGNKVFLLTPSVVEQPMVVGRIVQPEDWDDLRALVDTMAMMGTPSQPVPPEKELRKAHDDGYRLGLFFGEDFKLGYAASYHISRLYPLTESEFEGIREADCDPAKAAMMPEFEELEENIISAIEAHPDAPYRKRCENPACGSGRVMIAEYYEAYSLSPMALRMNVPKQSMDVLTAHSVTSEMVRMGKRVFHCLKCKWESDPLDEEQYTEVHACSHHKSAMEALFDVERFVL